MKESTDRELQKKWGKILLLSDTDEELINYPVENHDSLRCRRLINHSGLINHSDGITKWINIDSNPVSPATEIEDCLNGKLFIKTLHYFSEQDQFHYLNDIVDFENEFSEESSYFVLNLRLSDKNKLDEFFNTNNGSMKIEFARKYVEFMSEKDANYSEHMWITEIKTWFEE